jgi:DNA-binding transcriptional ArsR family regulator
MWQDGSVTETQPQEGEPLAVRTISNVDGLRALADPTRMALLSALMDQRKGELPIMSVKELAARLGEPQTKLYRHVKQLEAAGLIRVAATRMVSGILEQRYQACQRDFAFVNGFLREHADESEAVLQAASSPRLPTSGWHPTPCPRWPNICGRRCSRSRPGSARTGPRTSSRGLRRLCR